MTKIRQHNSTLSADPAKGLNRRKALRNKPPERTPTADRRRLERLTTAFVQEVYEACGNACAVCGYEGRYLQVHHVIEADRLKRHYSDVGDGGWSLDELLYDPSNGLLLCAEPAPNNCHGRHTLAVERIPRNCLRRENEAFAERVGMTWVLDRFYA